MTAETKITLSDKELALIHDTEWLLTKKDIIDKVCLLFGKVPAEIDKTIMVELAAYFGKATAAPKISKGENYLGLPYVVLDYPRKFTQDDTFAVRTLFWWGNFFSITLQLSGHSKSVFEKDLESRLKLLSEHMYICINEYAWHHHFGKDNFLPCSTFSMNQLTDIICGKDFIKLALRFDLARWNEMLPAIAEGYSQFGKLLTAEPVK